MLMRSAPSRISQWRMSFSLYLNATSRIFPETPDGATLVPNTGVMPGRSVEWWMRCGGGRCRSGSCQCTPSRRGGVRSLGTAGRFSGSTSAPQPWMCAVSRWRCCRSSGSVRSTYVGAPRSVEGGVVTSMAGPPSVHDGSAARHDHRLDDAVELAREHVVRLGNLVDREAVRDDLAGFEPPGLDVLDQPRQVALDH